MRFRLALPTLIAATFGLQQLGETQEQGKRKHSKAARSLCLSVSVSVCLCLSVCLKDCERLSQNL